MTALETLLQVQEKDTAIDQLRHRRATLPERSALSVLQQQSADLEARISEISARSEAVAARQSQLEDEVGTMDARVSDIERRLYSGTVSASRDLQAMSAEVTSVKSRRSSVEDEVLVAMEELEPLRRQLEALEADRAALDAESERVRAGLVGAEVAIDAEIEAESTARASMARAVPAELMRTYEGLRARLDGVGAARLVGSSCSGCHLVLPSAEVVRVKREPPDALVFCDQCGRILVR
ncbi:MAG TPA: C4-type zinc ribbon domain-containing protein [Acidimicrobiales bacterium]|nr:C4-type zinc ribbon domain-containing protein [Acidimicrobiales bacterium]